MLNVSVTSVLNRICGKEEERILCHNNKDRRGEKRSVLCLNNKRIEQDRRKKKCSMSQ